eukprot:PhM_4_TR2102/c3_g6_i2/m.6462
MFLNGPQPKTAAATEKVLASVIEVRSDATVKARSNIFHGHADVEHGKASSAVLEQALLVRRRAADGPQRLGVGDVDATGPREERPVREPHVRAIEGDAAAVHVAVEDHLRCVRPDVAVHLHTAVGVRPHDRDDGAGGEHERAALFVARRHGFHEALHAHRVRASLGIQPVARAVLHLLLLLCKEVVPIFAIERAADGEDVEVAVGVLTCKVLASLRQRRLGGQRRRQTRHDSPARDHHGVLGQQLAQVGDAAEGLEVEEELAARHRQRRAGGGPLIQRHEHAHVAALEVVHGHDARRQRARWLVGRRLPRRVLERELRLTAEEGTAQKWLEECQPTRTLTEHVVNSAACNVLHAPDRSHEAQRVDDVADAAQHVEHVRGLWRQRVVEGGALQRCRDAAEQLRGLGDFVVTHKLLHAFHRRVECGCLQCGVIVVVALSLLLRGEVKRRGGSRHLLEEHGALGRSCGGDDAASSGVVAQKGSGLQCTEELVEDLDGVEPYRHNCQARTQPVDELRDIEVGKQKMEVHSAAVAFFMVRTPFLNVSQDNLCEANDVAVHEFHDLVHRDVNVVTEMPLAAAREELTIRGVDFIRRPARPVVSAHKMMGNINKGQ